MPEVCKIIHFMELLNDKALTWATAVWERGSEPISLYEQFTRLFRCVFDHSLEGKQPGEELLTVSQGPCRIAEYALEFQTSAMRSEWDEPGLKAVCCNGLNPEVFTELACLDEQLALGSLIDLSIRVNHLLQSRCKFWSEGAPTAMCTTSEPMQLGRLCNSAKRKRRDDIESFDVFTVDRILISSSSAHSRLALTLGRVGVPSYQRESPSFLESPSWNHSTLGKGVSSLNGRATSSGGVYSGGSPTWVHQTLYIPCFNWFLLCGEEGRLPQAMLRLPRSQ